jgi:hypothetical protein
MAMLTKMFYKRITLHIIMLKMKEAEKVSSASF